MGIIYFAHDGTRIKVGYSSRPDPAKRLKEISAQGGLHMSLIGTTAGTLGQEQHLHAVLSEYRIRGEWYRDNAEFRHVVERCLSNLDEAILNPDGASSTFARVVRAMWPENHAQSLADAAGVSVSRAYRWLADLEELPAFVVAVLMNEMLCGND